MKAPALYVSVADTDLRWQIKQAALNERTTVRDLVIRILSEWLDTHGYPGVQTPHNAGMVSQ